MPTDTHTHDALTDSPCCELSIVVPACNEAGNIERLTQAIAGVFSSKALAIELIWVNDGSTDNTEQELQSLNSSETGIQAIRHFTHPSRLGQSATMHTGIQNARGRFIATLDADGQNDPADLWPMLEKAKKGDADFIQGDRTQSRQDPAIRKVGSAIGRAARRLVIGDPVRDTGCSARIMTRAIAQALPLHFRGLHRFMPAYARLIGARVIEVPVQHHPRKIGQTKYGMGIASRAGAGLIDLLAVRWMISRYQRAACSNTDKGQG